MNCRVTKSRPGSRGKPSEASRDAALGRSADITLEPPLSSSGRQTVEPSGLCQSPTERAQSRGAESPQDKTAAQPAKASLDTKLPNLSESPYSSLIESGAEDQKQASPAELLRKRRISDVHDSGADQPQRKRARLTRENLATLERMTRKKNGTALSSRLDSASSNSKTISTTSDGFALQAARNGILHPVKSKPPENLEEIRNQLSQPRESASPTGSVYEKYVHKVSTACNEATMVFEVGHKMLKEHPEGYDRAFNQAFTSFPKDVGFNDGLSTPQPDFVEGLQLQEYDPFPVEKHISGAMLYKDDPFSLTLPHVAGEWKGRGKEMEEARLQSAFDGAALVYARNQALEYTEAPDPAGYATVTTFTTDGTNLNFFSHYATPSGEDGALQYHQYPIASTSVKNSHEEFRKGWRQLRNAQDRAKEQSYQLRDELKEYWKASKAQPPAMLTPLEEEDGYELLQQQPTYQPSPFTTSDANHDKTPSLASGSTVSAPPRGVDPASGCGSGSSHKRKTPP